MLAKIVQLFTLEGIAWIPPTAGLETKTSLQMITWRFVTTHGSVPEQACQRAPRNRRTFDPSVRFARYTSG
jgi:hypothetical protein